MIKRFKPIRRTDHDSTVITCFECGAEIEIPAPMWFPEAVHASLTAERHWMATDLGIFCPECRT